METRNLSLKKFAHLYDNQGYGLTIRRYGIYGAAYCSLDRYPGQRHNGFACTRLLKYKTLLKWYESLS